MLEIAGHAPNKSPTGGDIRLTPDATLEHGYCYECFIEGHWRTIPAMQGSRLEVMISKTLAKMREQGDTVQPEQIIWLTRRSAA